VLVLALRYLVYTPHKLMLLGFPMDRTAPDITEILMKVALNTIKPNQTNGQTSSL